MRVDAHTHIWRTLPAAATGMPTIVPPQADVPIDLLRTYLDDHGIDRGVLVQPVYPGEDNSLVADCAAAEPDRYAAVCVVHPGNPDAPEKLNYWVRQRGCRGLRLRPRIPEEGIIFGHPSTFPLWESAAGLGIVVNVLGGLQHRAAIGELAERFPSVPIVIDHLAHPPMSFAAEAIAPLLDLARFSNIYLKLSGFYYFSRERYPFGDCAVLVATIYDRFGPARLVWGSDFPHVLLKTGYGRAIAVIEQLLPRLNSAEREQILGANASRLYWGE